MRKIVFLLPFFFVSNIFSQSDTTKSPVTFSGYIETYYVYDFSEPADHLRPPFFYSFNRHNEFNLNLGYIMAAYDKDGVRANLALMAGTYAQYNLSAEHPIMQHVLEATAGFKLCKKHNLWLDAGIMPSHIGWESAIGKVCMNLTRSLAAENSPYFESGVKLSYKSKKENFYFALLGLNGWQHIQRVPGCQTPSGGTQLGYTFNSKLHFNWSTFVGNEFPDSVRKWRYFNDFYLVWNPHKKFDLIAGFDIGYQQKAKGSSAYSNWYTPVLIGRVKFNDKFSAAFRLEYFYDADQVIISTGKIDGFQTYGYSVNVDYHIRENILWRLEGRALQAVNDIFPEKGTYTNQNYFAGTSLAISF